MTILLIRSSRDLIGDQRTVGEPGSEQGALERRELPAFNANSRALTANSARHAGSSFRPRSGRRSALRRAPVPDNVHSSFAHLAGLSHWGGGTGERQLSGTGIVAGSWWSLFSCSDAAVQPPVCVQDGLSYGTGAAAAKPCGIDSRCRVVTGSTDTLRQKQQVQPDDDMRTLSSTLDPGHRLWANGSGDRMCSM
jgi:hypothetical protein